MSKKTTSLIVVVVVLMGAGYYISVNKNETSINQTSNIKTDTENTSYALYEMTDKSIIRITTGKAGEKVYLLNNPEFREAGDSFPKVIIPLAPQNPIWDFVPNGSYTNSFGARYLIQDSKIVSVTDRNGHRY